MPLSFSGARSASAVSSNAVQHHSSHRRHSKRKLGWAQRQRLKRPKDPQLGALLREALRRTQASNTGVHWYVHRTPPGGEWTLGHY